MKELKHISYVSEAQIEFCEAVGLFVRGDTVARALAKLEDLIDERFHGKADLGRPTQKQVELATRFGYDISSFSRREGDAIISDIMIELNLESVEEQQLAPGVAVINRWDRLQRIEVVSSIQKDGLVFLKGGNGKRAWARSLSRVDSQERKDGR